jgi:hypothetical protein
MKVGHPYARHSEGRQGQGDSIRRQSAWHERIAENEGLTLDYSLNLIDRGKSAFHAEHLKAALGRFIAAIASGRVKPGEALLVEELDRLIRMEPKKSVPLIVSILSSGVEIYTREKHYTEDSLGDLVSLVEIWSKAKTAHDESQKKSFRIRDNWSNWRAQVAAGVKVPPPGKMPGWVCWDGDAREFRLVEPAAAAVRLIYRWAAEGLGIDRIVARLNREGVPPVGRQPSWRVSYVAKLLSGREVLGDLTTKGGQVHRGFYPAAVTEAEWGRARTALESRKRPRTGGGRGGPGREGNDVANLFSGLVRDARDGEFMHVHQYAGGKGKTRRALVSAGALRGEPGSTFAMMPYNLLESAVLWYAYELKPADLLGKERSADEERLAVLNGRDADLTGKIDRTKAKVREVGPVDALTDLLVTWERELKAVRAERDALATKLATDRSKSLDDVKGLLALLGKLREGEERADLRRRLKARIRELVSEVWVLTYEVDRVTRAAEIQVRLDGGITHAIPIAWTHGGRYPGLAVGLGQRVSGAGWDSHLADKLLSNYRTDPATRDFFDGLHAEARPLWLRAVAEQMDYRAELARRNDGAEALALYLDGFTLDGVRPPRRPGRPRKVKAV